MNKLPDDFKNKLEELSKMNGIFGIFAYKNNKPIYSKCAPGNNLVSPEQTGVLSELLSAIEKTVVELDLSDDESTIQFSENFKIILLNKKENNHDYKLCFLTSKYIDTISINKYID